MRATGIARSTIGRGLAELRAGETPDLDGYAGAAAVVGRERDG